MARSWLSIRVDLVEGGVREIWPRPGRMFAAARTHSFSALARAIDDAFARWDHSHLHAFEMADEARLGSVGPWDDSSDTVDSGSVKLSRLSAGEQFVYVYDFGDDWTHLCTVGAERIDPMETLGILASKPLPYSGWGDIPDQYGRRWDTDDGESDPPPNPGKRDLPPLRPWWGEGAYPHN